MQNISFIFCLIVFLVGCGLVRNGVNAVKLNCGSEVAADSQMVKILAADGKDLSADELEVLTWSQDGQLLPVHRSSKGCFAVDASADYIIRATRLGQALRVSAEQLRDRPILRLVDGVNSSVGLSCRQDFMRTDSNLLAGIQWQGRAESDAFTVNWSIFTADGTTPIATGEQLLTTENHDSIRRTLPSDLPEGSYRISMNIHNLLRNQPAAKGDCRVTLDRQPPIQTLQWTSRGESTHASFSTVVPGSNLVVKTQDLTATQSFICLTPLADPDDKSASPMPQDCSWQSIPGHIPAPASGYWQIQSKTIDAAGNESAIETRKIFAFNQQTIDLIKALSASIDAHMKGDGDPLEGAYNALKAENLRRSLQTVYERSLAQNSADRALYRILHQSFPHRVQKIDGQLLGVTVSPNEDYFAVWAGGTGNTYLYRADGTLIWKRQLDDSGSKATFSPDSKQFALAGQNGQVKVWAVESGEELFHFNRRTKPWVFKYRADGAALGFAGFDNGLVIWDINPDHGLDENTVLSETFIEQLNDFDWNAANELTVAVGPNLRFYDASWRAKAIDRFTVETSSGGMVSAIAELEDGYRFITSQSVEQRSQAANPALSSTTLTILTPELKVLAQEKLPGVLDRSRRSPSGKHFAIGGNGQEGVAILQDWTALKGQAEGGTFNGHLFVSKATPKETSGIYWAQDSSQFTTTSFSGEVSVLNLQGILVNRIVGQNTDLFGPVGILPTHNLMVTGGANQMLRFWDLESRLFPSYHAQGLIAHHTMNSDQSKHLIVERRKFEYRMVVLDVNLEPLSSWTLPSSEVYLRYPITDFSPVFRSFRLLDNNQILSGDFYKSIIDRHHLDGRPALDHPARNVALPGALMTSFSPLPGDEGFVVGYSNGSIRAYRNGDSTELFTTRAHKTTDQYYAQDMTNASVLNLEAVADGNIYSTGMDGRLIQYSSTGEAQVLLNTTSTMNIYHHYADDSLLIGGRGMAILRYFRPDGTVTRIADGVDFRLVTAAASPGGKFFAAGLGQGAGRIVIADAEGRPQQALDLFYKNNPSSVTFSKDGQRLLAAGSNRLFTVPLDPAAIYQRVCARLEVQLRSEAEATADFCPERQPTP